MRTQSSKTLTTDEERRLLERLYRTDRRYFTAALLAVTTGLRISELCALTRSDVASGDTIRNILTIREEITKRGTERMIPLPTITRQALTNYLEDRDVRSPRLRPPDHLFSTNYDRGPMTPRSFQRALAAAGTAAIGRRVTPHMLRHTYLTRILKNSDIRVAQELAGHRSIRSTERYTHPDLDDVTGAVARTYPEEKAT